MPWYPGAIRKEIPRFRTKQKPARINYHTAVSSTTSLYAYFAPYGRVCSHFYVREDGTVEQYVDTDYRAAADLDGNADTISIETWDGYMRIWRDGQPVPPWTPAQMRALADLTRWILATHPSIPARIATDSRVGATSQGLSWHRLGCPYRVLDKSKRILGSPIVAGYCQPGGTWYSTSAGKQCPGEARIAQIRTIYAALTAPLSPPPAPAPPQEVPVDVTLIKSPNRGHALIAPGYYYAVPDGEYLAVILDRIDPLIHDTMTDREYDVLRDVAKSGTDNATEAVLAAVAGLDLAPSLPPDVDAEAVAAAVLAAIRDALGAVA